MKSNVNRIYLCNSRVVYSSRGKVEATGFKRETDKLTRVTGGMVI